jgi:hypothetical protein
MDTNFYNNMIHEKAEVVVIAVGGDEINPTSSPKEIIWRISEFNDDLQARGTIS